jgi:hypothetical protein
MSGGWSSAEALVREAEEQFSSLRSDDLRADVAREIDELHRYYDLRGISRVVAIEPWGRSGSILLASYFDGHDDVMALPALRSNGIYIFFAAYRTLSLRDKLVAYPLFDEFHDPHSDAAGCGRSLFEGPFAIERRRYLTAVLAVCAVYDTLPAEFANSGKGFFVAVHVAFNLALGRRPQTPTPLIVCAQHERDNPNATHLTEDFSDVRFIHTVRDPISAVDRLFDWFFDPKLLPDRQPTAAERANGGEVRSARYISVLAPWMVLRLTIDADRPHQGMQGRTRVVRFEDMHGRTEETLLDLAGWLGLSFAPALKESTFTGKPYVVTRDGKAWSGARREKLKREARNLSRRDRALIYALFHDNFVAWGYPYPKVFDYRLVRLLSIALAGLIPMRMEAIVAKAAWRRRVWPWLKRGHWRTPADTLARLAFSRVAIGYLAAREIWRRVLRRKHPVELSRTSAAPLDELIG